MNQRENHITPTISTQIQIKGDRQTIWNKITNVQIEEFPHPTIFQLLGIPKPLRAEIIFDGVGGQRIAYFDIKRDSCKKSLLIDLRNEFT